LQYLFTSMPCSTAQLAALQRLTGLHTLYVGAGDGDDCEGVQALGQLTGLQTLKLTVASIGLECVQALCQLTGLRDLELGGGDVCDAHILQLTKLDQLTDLRFQHNGTREGLYCDPEVSCD
jgi:hypothetical protein